MSEMTIQEAFDLALEHHRAGRLGDAEILYRRILQTQPGHADSLHLLGVIAHQAGKSEVAVELIRRAIALEADAPSYFCNLAIVLEALKRPSEAEAVAREALSRHPMHAPAYNALGNSLNNLARHDEAISAQRRAIELQPDYCAAYISLANPLINTRRFDEAIAACRKAVELSPDLAEAHANLGLALHGADRLAEAAEAYQRALKLRPDLGETANHLAYALGKLHRHGEALEAYRRAIELQPQRGDTHARLAGVLIEMGRLNGAVAIARKAIALSPELADGHFALGRAQSLRGDMDEALAAFQRAIELRDDYAAARGNIGAVLNNMARLDEAVAAHRAMLDRFPNDIVPRNNLLYTMLFHPDYPPEAVLAEFKEWNERHAAPLAADIQPHQNDRNPRRRLRIGYVSPDFREHVIGRNILPILREHDHSQVEIFCYSAAIRPDEITEQFKAIADEWRDIGWKEDADVAEMVRRDRIDILVDLTLHMIGNRLLVFARKPAPVQVTWAGYPGGTGVAAMDYRLTDPRLDPPGENDGFYLEKSYRLPDSFWCYDPAASDVPVNALPAAERGYATFGCFNNFCKVNEKVLALWAAVMRETPESRLLLLAPEGSCRAWVRDLMETHGVAAGRVEFCDRAPHAEYLRLYHRVDIALDTFPYNGHTTALDALWMGVPTVTLCGRSAVSRAGLSQLTNLGLTELVAHDEAQFVTIAAALARDTARLGDLRKSLRQRMAQSPLVDARRFARNLESAYRATWTQWCEQRDSAPT